MYITLCALYLPFNTVISVVFILIILNTTNIYPQSFPISTQPSERYSIDKFNNEVYYLTYLTQQVYKRNLLTGNTELSVFPTLPTFANYSHLCVYGQSDSVFVYDFESNSRKIICDSVPNNASYGWSFSPEDNYIIFKDYYFSFTDSTTYPISYYPEVMYSALEWLNDSTIIINFYPDDYIYSYCFTTGLFDSIYIQPAGFSIAGFSYDQVKSDFYYCLFDPSQPNYPKIRVKNLITQTDSIIFDSFIHDPTNICWELLCSIRSMKWFQQTSSLVFIGSELTNPIAGIYVYRAPEGEVYRYSDCDDEGYKLILNWYSKDTIIYVSSSYDWIRIEGYFLDRPLSVEDSRDFSLETYEISNYPNPFNSTTKITYSIPVSGKVRLVIYDALGREVSKLIDEEKTAGRYEVEFNANGLASGIYFYRLSVGDRVISKKMILIK